jgi:DNA-binding IclR family transcriptional regulator
VLLSPGRYSDGLLIFHAVLVPLGWAPASGPGEIFLPQHDVRRSDKGTNSHYLGVTFIFRDDVDALLLDVRDYAEPMDTPETSESGPAPPLQTVDRALEILLSYSEFRSDWGVLELAEEFGLGKSSSQRLLAALAARGFLRADPYTRRYRLGPAMWRMAALWERSGGLAALADEPLLELSRVSGRTSLFAIPDGVHVRCIAAVDGMNGPTRVHPFIDELYPAHAGATSRAYFAFIDPAERKASLAGRPFAKYSGLTEINEQALEVLYDTTLEAGHAFSEGEYDPGTRALAVPVFLGRRPIGSVSIVEGKLSAPDEDIRDQLPALQAASDQLSRLLANRPPAAPRRDWRKGIRTSS